MLKLKILKIKDNCDIFHRISEVFTKLAKIKLGSVIDLLEKVKLDSK